ncbi:MAG: hypothetical protein M0R06_03060 [Sphaerochaeta sp.]|jgi:hypothetical protein|nr:hypothetical protein [Sphaerochaeta sp.]
MLGLSTQELAQGLFSVLIGGYLFFKWLRERKAVKRGLAPNPTRCQEHADAINGIKDQINDELLPDIKRIKEKLDIV